MVLNSVSTRQTGFFYIWVKQRRWSWVEPRSWSANKDKVIYAYKPLKTESVDDASMKIALTDNVGLCQRARRWSFTEKQDVFRQIQKWLKQAIIRSIFSDYVSLVVLVKKTGNTIRLRINNRKLNRKLVKDRSSPLPLIEDFLDKLQNAKVYSL